MREGGGDSGFAVMVFEVVDIVQGLNYRIVSDTASRLKKASRIEKVLNR